MTKEKKKRCINIILLTAAIMAAAAIFAFLASNGLGIPCFYNKFTGLLCPGCGNTRAALALLKLDIRSALSYNLMFPLEFLYICWIYSYCAVSYIRSNKFAYRKQARRSDICVMIIIAIWTVVRNIINIIN